MQVPILRGSVVKDGAFAESYPINLRPRPIDSGVSAGQLVNATGVVSKSTGPGADRGGIDWNGTMYRVMGSKLVRVANDGAVTEIGDVGNDTRRCGFDYSFDRLGVRSAGKLFYYDGAALSQVTDPDLGDVRDMLWMDGYFVTTDGNYVVVTDLLDVTKVDPLKYGSAEEDPDTVTGIDKIAEELVVAGRYTFQFFQNIGAAPFPFTVVPGTTIPVGCVSASAKAKIAGASLAFVGGGRNEPLGVYVLQNASATRISTREIDEMIAAVPSPELIEVEVRSLAGEQQVLVHLESVTVAISVATSDQAQRTTPFLLSSGGAYRPRNAVYCYGKHWVGDVAGNALGVLDEGTHLQFGQEYDWQFDGGLMFNEGNGFLVNEVELFGQFPVTPFAVFFSITRDGVHWSREVARRTTGRPNERVNWRPGVWMPSFGSFRWRGRGRVALARCEVRGDQLSA